MLLRAVVIVLALLSGLSSAVAKSLALVIGNDTYAEITSLQKARADAAGYAALFAARGFAVTQRSDVGSRDMIIELANFYDQIAPGDTVAFVYSGHGWSDGRQNFLVPTDIRAGGSETLLAQQSFPLRNGANGIIDEIARRGPGLTIAIIDACRNNPFPRDNGTRSVGLARGLVQVSAPVGTFIAFSAGEGQTALDRLSDSDATPYSVFTRFFLQELSKPQDLQTAFKATQQAVNDTALSIGHPQRPAYYDEVIGSACLDASCLTGGGTPQTPVPIAPAPDPVQAAQAEWQDFKHSGSVDVLRQFADRHSNTPYAALAMERVRQLELAAVPEPEPQVRSDYPRPSWCPKAATRTETAICGSARLSELDITMSDHYGALLGRLTKSSQQTLKADQRVWLAERNRCSGDTACLGYQYEMRIAQLRP